MLALGVIFLAGVLHGLGPDHLAAITAFGAFGGTDFRRISFFSLRFAAGHAVVISAAALLAHFGRMALPLSWERGFDLAAGGLLVLTGTGLLFALVSGRLSFHAHQHHHSGATHEHLHAHFVGHSGHQHSHGKFALALGGLFALGGARSLLVIVPVALAGTVAVSLLRIAAFAAGIVMAMSAYGLAAGQVLPRAAGRGSTALQRLTFALTTTGVALFSILAGLLTLGQRLHS